MNISEYCGRLKRLVDTLYDCGAVISDPMLVINTLRGLNNKFSQAIAVLSTMCPHPHSSTPNPICYMRNTA
jgi:hypothetical protein